MFVHLKTAKEQDGIVINVDDISEIEFIADISGTVVMKTTGTKISISFDECMSLISFLRMSGKTIVLHGDV